MYEKNAYVNARHLYQSNLVTLSQSEAPLMLNSTVVSIEKYENHKADWQSKAHPYRLKVQTPNGKEKYIYTDTIDIAAGFGEALIFSREILYNRMSLMS